MLVLFVEHLCRHNNLSTPIKDYLLTALLPSVYLIFVLVMNLMFGSIVGGGVSMHHSGGGIVSAVTLVTKKV